MNVMFYTTTGKSSSPIHQRERYSESFLGLFEFFPITHPHNIVRAFFSFFPLFYLEFSSSFEMFTWYLHR